MSRSALRTLLLTAGTLLLGSGARAEIVDQVAAIVEDEIVTFSEVHWLAEYRNLPIPEQPEDRRAFYLDLANQLVDQKILAAEAIQTPGITVTSDEVEAQLRAYRARFETEEAFRQHLAAMDMTVEALRDLFRRQLAVNKLVDVRFQPFIIVLPDQIEEYYREEFLPELAAAGQPIPPLELVEESIRQILVERRIIAELDRWLRNQRRRARVDILLYRTPRFAPNLPQQFLDEVQLRPVTAAEENSP